MAEKPDNKINERFDYLMIIHIEENCNFPISIWANASFCREVLLRMLVKVFNPSLTEIFQIIIIKIIEVLKMFQTNTLILKQEHRTRIELKKISEINIL
jgi:hypothetical protein